MVGGIIAFASGLIGAIIGFLVSLAFNKCNCAESLQLIDARNNFDTQLQERFSQEDSLRSEIGILQRELADSNNRAQNAFAKGERQGCQLKTCPACPQCTACPVCPPERPECSIAFANGSVTGCNAIRGRVNRLYEDQRQTLALAEALGDKSEENYRVGQEWKAKSEKDYANLIEMNQIYERQRQQTLKRKEEGEEWKAKYEQADRQKTQLEADKAKQQEDMTITASNLRTVEQSFNRVCSISRIPNPDDSSTLKRWHHDIVTHICPT